MSSRLHYKCVPTGLEDKSTRMDTKLSEVLPQLEQAVELLRVNVGGITGTARVSRKRAYKSLLLEDYREVTIIFRRILGTLQRLQPIQDQVFREGNASTTLVQQMLNETSTFAVDVKSLYLWTAHISDVFAKSGAAVDLAELERISLFRHKFITHVHQTPVFEKSTTIRAGVKYHLENEHIEVLFHSMFFRKSHFRGMKRLVRRVSLFVPELAHEGNYWNQLYILYRRLNAITDKSLRREVQIKIFELGNSSEPPSVLAQALLTALRSFLTLKDFR
jgi:hypothetical protein